MVTPVCFWLSCYILLWASVHPKAVGASIPTDEVARALEAARAAKGLSSQDQDSFYVGTNHHLINWDGDWGDMLLQTTQPLRAGLLDPQFRNVERQYADLEQDIESLRGRLTVSRPPAEPLVPELSIEERKAALLRIRKQIYQRSGTDFDPKKGASVYPYRNHLTPEQLNTFVLDMKISTKSPWLWTSDDGRRFLLRQERSRGEAFGWLNGFRSDKHHKIFFAAWQEAAPPFSNRWQYLGAFRAPEWHKLSVYKASTLDRSRYPITAYKVLSSSSFEANIH